MRLALTLLAWLALLAPAAMAAQPRNVLVLYSNNRLLPANVEVDHGLREALATSAERPVELFAEFLDQPAFTGPAYERASATYLREEYAERALDTIVAAGPSALDFVLRHRAGLFPGVPVVHVAVDEPYLKSRQPLPADVVGVPVLYDFAGTIEQALRWRPSTRRLVVVTGTSFIDLRWEAETRAVVARLQPAVPAEYAGGDASYAIGLAVAIALLSVVTVPLAVALFTSAFDRSGEVAVWTVAKTVGTTILVPLAAGIALHRWSRGLARKLARPVSIFGLVLLVVSALPVAVALWPAMSALQGDGTVLVLALMAVIGLGVGHALGGPEADTRTNLALSTASRHPAVALAAANAVVGSTEAKPALAAILLYVVIAILVSIPYVAWRKRLAVADTRGPLMTRDGH